MTRQSGKETSSGRSHLSVLAKMLEYSARDESPQRRQQRQAEAKKLRELGRQPPKEL